MKRAFPIAATAVGVLCAAPAADASIVVQKSIAGVSIGMDRAQVQEVLGKPSAVRTETSEIFGKYTVLRYGLTEVSLFRGDQPTVFALTTRSKKQRTSNDVGVGSSEKVLRRRIKGLKCTTYAKTHRMCTRGGFKPGDRVTDFRISTKTRRVTRVSIGIVID
ncbi:hypothetical protein [Paraconexibacter sp.]|uniref:hypothetical protein n=1 Tax=Paraconexibacter sp. TaxID=2949640 RepID=UPI003562E601